MATDFGLFERRISRVPERPNFARALRGGNRLVGALRTGAIWFRIALSRRPWSGSACLIVPPPCLCEGVRHAASGAGSDVDRTLPVAT